MALRIVRDYEKYISRQLKRGTTRQELNVSWLKKNELDLKRHVNEIRETIKNNWSTTGRELRDEFRNYWAPTPRSGSPYQFGNGSGHTMSPTAEKGGFLDPGSRPESPSREFAAGYSMGLIGGVRSWVCLESDIDSVFILTKLQMRSRNVGSKYASEANSEDESDGSDGKNSPTQKAKSTDGNQSPGKMSDVAVRDTDAKVTDTKT